MPQVAQQDYLRIAIANPGAPTDEEIAQIQKHVQQGTIWDVLVEINGAYGRVLSVSTNELYVHSATEGDIIVIEFGE